MTTIRRLFLVILFFPSVLRADWLWTRQVVANAGTVRTIEYGGGLFVAGTNTGYLLSSRDGVTWTVTRPVSQAINDISFGRGRFVAIVDQVTGSKAKVLYSSDGVNWFYARRIANNGVFGSRDNLGVVATRGGRFIALGSASNAFATSVNGTRWANPLKSGKPAKYVGSVTGLTASGEYVMGSRLAGATIQTSKDGFSWDTRFMTSARGPARGIAAQKPGSRVVCVGENGLCLVSGSNGRSWRSEPFGSVDFLGVAATNSLFAGVTDKNVYSSPNGSGWSRQLRLSRSGDHLRAVATGGGLFVAAGNAGKNALLYVSSAQPGPSAAQ